jgi:hypothetical protein
VLLEPDCENFLYIEALAWQAHLDDLNKIDDIWLCIDGSLFQMENTE